MRSIFTLFLTGVGGECDSECQTSELAMSRDIVVSPLPYFENV
jgi:hypothetical protein